MALRSGREGVRKDQVDKEGRIKDIKKNGLDILRSVNLLIEIRDGEGESEFLLTDGRKLKDYKIITICGTPVITYQDGVILTNDIVINVPIKKPLGSDEEGTTNVLYYVPSTPLLEVFPGNVGFSVRVSETESGFLKIEINNIGTEENTALVAFSVDSVYGMR